MTATAQAAAPVENLPARAKPSLVSKFAAKYTIDAEKLLPILKATAFKQKKGAPEVTNEQMAALLVVADQYGLNPFTREIFAFPDKQNGIVPVVSVDGWGRIINENAMMNGLEFRYSDSLVPVGGLEGLRVRGHEWIEAVIYRKDRDKPTIVREYLEEVYRPPFKFDDGNTREGAWQTHTKRMHRHKALIQGARVAFGFAGIYDEDEATRIIEGHVLPTDPLPIEPQRGAAGLKAALGANAKEPGTLEQRDAFVKKFGECKDPEVLALVRDEANLYEWSPADKEVLDVAYSRRQDEMKAVS